MYLNKPTEFTYVKNIQFDVLKSQIFDFTQFCKFQSYQNPTTGLNLASFRKSFVEDYYVVGKKMTRNGNKMAKSLFCIYFCA